MSNVVRSGLAEFGHIVEKCFKNAGELQTDTVEVKNNKGALFLGLTSWGQLFKASLAQRLR